MTLRPETAQRENDPGERAEYERQLAEALAALLVAEHRRRSESDKRKAESKSHEDAA